MEIDRAAPSCYRHPDRETRLRCSECGRPICPECSHDAAVGQKCPVCADQGRTRVVSARSMRRSGFDTAPVSYSIIAVSAVLFVIGFNASIVEFPYRQLAQFNILVEQGEWWRVITAAGLHGGLAHILFNMYALYLFGPRLEQEAGSVPFAVAYAASAIAGGAAFYLFGDPRGVAVGASGAIFGLFGVWLAASWRLRNTVYGRAVFNQLIFLLALNAALPFIIRNIAWEAHAGGLIAGVLIGLAWGRWAAPRPRAEAVPIRITVAAVVGLLPLLTIFFG